LLILSNLDSSDPRSASFSNKRRSEIRAWSFYIPRGKGGAGGFACQTLPKEHRIARLAGRDGWNQALPETLHGTSSESIQLDSGSQKTPFLLGLIGSVELWPWFNAAWQAKPPAPPASHLPSANREM